MPQPHAGTPPLDAPDRNARQIRRMFTTVAPRYDLLNHVLSLNVDRRWRRIAVDALQWERVPGGTYLDTCAGTLDLSVELAGRRGFQGRVVGSDFTYAMLERGREKVAALPVESACADALALPFGDAVFDGAAVGFGVRNLADLDAGLRETARVLKPGARFVVLEFTTPRWQPFRALYLTYFLRVLPAVGRLLSDNGAAYGYLPRSVLSFPDPVELAAKMERAGFHDVGWRMLSGGIAALHWGTRR